MKRLRDQRGIAMVTVLFIGMVLTVVVSSAAFITVREVQSGTDDTRSGRALAYAEAGIDRAYQWLRSPTGWKFKALSGCPFTGTPPTTATTATLQSFSGELATGTGNVGTFSANIVPYDPSNTYCSTTIGAIDSEVGPPIDVPYKMVVTSTGIYQNTTKVVKQLVELSIEDFPLGMSAGNLDANGNATVRNMSIMTTSTVTGRNKIDMEGTDFFYTKGDFYCPNGVCPGGMTSTTAAEMMPASVHSADRILISGGRSEHPPNLNCTADRDSGDGRTSGWDGSSAGKTISSGTCSDANPPPPTSSFTMSNYTEIASVPRLSTDDHLLFKSIAQQSGIYCGISAAGTASCSRLGITDNNIGTAVSTTDVTNNPSACPASPCAFVAYFEFAGGNALTNKVQWDAAVPNVCSAGLVVLIVKNGSVKFNGNARFSGAVFTEDGQVESAGSPQIEGMVVAKRVTMKGTPTYSMSQCWLNNLPGPFLKVTALRWSEADR